MHYKDALTILIPLWGRERETKTILNYMNDMKFPFKILLADGGGTNLSSWVSSESFSNLDLLYVDYGRDNSIHDFMVKMNKSSSLITTPLTIMADNDDFLSLDGLMHGVKFLNDNKDYTSYRGDVRCVRSGNSIYKQPTKSGNTSLERFTFPNGGLNSGWHDIVRTYTLKKFFEALSKSKTNDLQLVFFINKYWHTLYGKSYKDSSTPFYYHVHGNSLVWGKGLYSTTNTWMSNKDFIDSMAFNISMVSSLLHKQNGEDLSQIKDKVTNIILTHLKELNNYDEDITELKDNIIKNSYNYDDLVLSILDKPDINTSFNLTEIPNINLDYDNDINNLPDYQIWHT